MGIVSGGGGGAGLAIPFDVTGGSTELSADTTGTLTLRATGAHHADIELSEAISAALASLTSNGGLAVSANGAVVQTQNLAGTAGAGGSDTLGLFTFRNTTPADGDLFPGLCALWFDPTNGASKLMVKAQQADGTVKTAAIALA